MSGASGSEEATVGRARELVSAARGVLVLTGAGLSADSGLPTFRGEKGQWRKHRPEDLATPEAFRRDPRLVWEWYDARRRAAAETRPNDAHLAIAALALRRDDIVVVTQNVDGLHTEAARTVAGEVDAARAFPLELHGCFFRTRCTACSVRNEQREPVDTRSAATLPRCQECGGLLRPDVVWFGESLGEAFERAVGCAAQSEVCLVVGTSAVVQPAAGVAMVTRRAGGAIIEVNPEATPLTPKSAVSLRGTAATIVPSLLSPPSDG